MPNVETDAEDIAAEPAPAFEHDAFISYSRKDKAFAAKLEKALEEYRPPRDLPVPQRHLHVFRDEADLTGAEYHQSVEKHLAVARKLIVLCSPHARKSEYVADEIRRFIHLRGAANVIPILLAGIPNNEAGQGRDEEMAFPDALCEALTMPLAASYVRFDARRDRLQKGAFENAWHIVLANLYDVGRAELEQREKRRQARQRRMRAALAGTFITLLSVALIVSLYFWRQAVVERNTALSRELAANALGELQNDPDLSVVLAMEGLRVSRTAQAEAALREALLTTRVLSVMEGTGRALNSAVLSPDGRLAALAAQDNTASVWRVDTGERVAEMRGHSDNVVDVAFGPDGRRIATSSWDNTARTWDAATGRQLLELRGHTQSVTAARFSPDGRLVATGSPDGTVRLWDAENGSPIRVLQAHERLGPLQNGRVRVAFSPDGGQLLTSSGNFVTASGDVAAKLWNVADGTLVRAMPASKAGVVIEAAFSRDGSRILVAGDRGSSAWDRRTGERLSEFDNQSGIAEAAAFSPDGRVALTAAGSNVVLTDVSTGRVLATLAGHLDSVRSAAFDADGRRVLTGLRDGSTQVWDVATAALLARLTGQRDDLVATTFGRDPMTVFTASRDGSARLWYAGEARRVAVLPLGADANRGPRFSTDGAFLIGDAGNDTIVWDAATGRELTRVPGTWLLDPRGRLISSGRDEGRPADPVRAAGATMQFVRSGDPAATLAVSRDGRLVLTTDDRYNASLRTLDTGTELVAITKHKATINDALFAPDGQWLVTVADDGAWVWDVATGQERTELPLDNRGYQARLSPDGRLLAVVADTAHTRIWDVATWRRLPDAIGSDRNYAWAKAGAWSPDSVRLAVGDSTGTVRVWDVGANRLVVAFAAHRYEARTVTFSSDGALLLTTGLDNRARVWNPSTGQLVAEVAGESGAVFSPDGRRVATIAPRGSVSLYPWEAFAQVEMLERLAAARVKRTLTAAERERYLHEPEPPQ